MEEMRRNVRRKPGLFWALEIIYLIFTGCTSFPLRADVQQAAVLLIGIVIMAVILAALMDRCVWKAWGLGLVCLAAGVAVRYVLEFGEVSNTVNFTPVNLAVFLVGVSAVFAGVYALAARR